MEQKQVRRTRFSFALEFGSTPSATALEIIANSLPFNLVFLLSVWHEEALMPITHIN
jgi:hypothetical protein